MDATMTTDEDEIMNFRLANMVEHIALESYEMIAAWKRAGINCAPKRFDELLTHAGLLTLIQSIKLHFLCF